MLHRPLFTPSAPHGPATVLLPLLALLVFTGCDHDAFDFIYDDEPVASGRWSAELVDDPGAGGHVIVQFDGVFDPGDGASDDLAEIEVFLDSGSEALSFQLDEDSGWDLVQRLDTITVDADYDERDERFRLTARLDADDDAPHQMEARVRYRVRYWGSSDDRFSREYTWRELVEF